MASPTSVRRTAVAIGAGLLVLAALAWLSDRLASRPRGRVADLARLAERNDTSLIFVLIDTLRADRLSAYGYPRPTSPNLDALAATGVRFANTISQSSWTKCSMASLWTASYPARNGILRYPDSLPGAVLMPAEILRDAGFRTAGIWRNGWVAPNFGFGQGFELYVSPRASLTPERFHRHTPGTNPLLGTDWDTTESAIEFLRGVGNQRFFLYLHYMDVHQYVFDDTADFGGSYSDFYDNAIAWTDRNLGLLKQALDDLGLSRRTVWVVASDHGESFREHGSEGHARTLYQEVTHVPWVLALPFRLEPGIVVEPLVRNIDIWPTLLDLIGLTPLPGAQGRSLVPLILSAGAGAPASDGDGEPTAIAHLDRTWGRAGQEPNPMVALTSGRFRLIRWSRRPGVDELYDHSADPGERVNVAGAHPDVVAALGEQVNAYLDQPGAEWGRPDQVELDELMLGQLRALGYAVRPRTGEARQ